MSENNECKKNNEQELLRNIRESVDNSSPSFYKEPSTDSQFYSLESHFNNNVIFYQDITVHGKLNFNATKSEPFIANDLVVLGISTFFGPADFYDDVYIDGNLRVGIATVRDKLNIGCGGTTLIADNSTGRIGVGTTNPRQVVDIIGTAIVSENIGVGSTSPQQKIDVAGSIKIDETIFDSSNVPGKNGYFITRDQGGLRWVPLIADSRPEVPGITTDGIFVLDEGVPLYPS